MLLRENPFTNKRIELHILQSFPVTCLNRDDIGSPKTAFIGGVKRARVSSQCWKRQVRLMMREFGVKIAIRTKYLNEKLILAMKDMEVEPDKAEACSSAVVKILSKDTLHFISQHEIDALAHYCKEIEFNYKKVKTKDVLVIHKKSFNPSVDGLDIALFGRMVAQAPELNVEAAASFSHAISTHASSTEIDFFTAIDDFNVSENLGSSHLGSIEFNSATYYRYVSLDLGLLYNTCFGQEGFEKAIDSFIKALYIAVPSARQASQSGACFWDYAKILIRKGQRLQLSFEQPVKSVKGTGFLQPSIDAMKSAIEKKEKLTGSLYGKIADYEFGQDESFSIDDLCEKIISDIRV